MLMIKLSKGQKPAILDTHGDAWTREFTEHTGPLSRMRRAARYRYREPEIKKAVKRDSYAKCIYCESEVTQVHPGDIDHILPVSKRRDLAVDWDNLAFVCNACNTAKHDYYEPALPLLNPYVDEPNEHLAFFGPVVLHRSGADRGEITVLRLKLNDLKDRPGLFERRKDHIDSLCKDLDRIEKEPSGPLRDALEKALQRRLANDQEYAAVAREFVRQVRENQGGQGE